MSDSIQFPWRRLLEVAGEDPANPDKDKILSLVGEQFDAWIASGRASQFPGALLDARFEKDAPKVIHAILKGAGNRLRLDALAAAYCLRTAQRLDDDALTFFKEQMRAYVTKHHTGAFSITRGGSATVYRVKDEKGKATGAAIPDAEPVNGKALQRYTSTVKDVGTRDEFNAAKIALGKTAITRDEFAQWRSTIGKG